MINRLVILAAVLMAVCMVYSMADLLGVADAHESDDGETVDIPHEQSPYSARIIRPDGATVTIRADYARIWKDSGDGDRPPSWLELEGDVTIDAPEGRIQAPRLAYDPHTGRYHAESLGLIPAGGN